MNRGEIPKEVKCALKREGATDLCLKRCHAELAVAVYALAAHIH